MTGYIELYHIHAWQLLYTTRRPVQNFVLCPGNSHTLDQHSVGLSRALVWQHGHTIERLLRNFYWYHDHGRTCRPDYIWHLHVHFLKLSNTTGRPLNSLFQCPNHVENTRPGLPAQHPHFVLPIKKTSEKPVYNLVAHLCLW